MWFAEHAKKVNESYGSINTVGEMELWMNATQNIKGDWELLFWGMAMDAFKPCEEGRELPMSNEGVV